MPKIKSSITLVDVQDTATYIYYAKDSTGQSAVIAPAQGEKYYYIGFYSGPPVKGGQPQPGTQEYDNLQIQWTRYYGDTGNGITKTTFFYQIGSSQTERPSGEWLVTIPAATSVEPYLWTKTITYYSDPKQKPMESYSVSRAFLDSGYQLATNAEEIFRFYSSKEGSIVREFSPSDLIVSLRKQINTEPLLTSEYQIRFIGEFSSQSVVIPIRAITTKEDANGRTTLYAINFDSIISTPTSFFESEEQKQIEIDWLKTAFKEDNVLIRIEALDLKGERIAIKPVFLSPGTTDQLARFSVNASSISAAIDSSKLIFDHDGLHVQNGGLEIKQDERRVFYTDNGNLNITGYINALGGKFRGEIEATGGSFRGRIEAEEGYFKGNLQARSGDIGGFSIVTKEENGPDGKFFHSFLVSKSKKSNTQPDIIIDGQEGFIKANNLTIGEGARIEGSLQLGDNVFLKSLQGGDPLKDNPFLRVSSLEDPDSTILELTDKGRIGLYSEGGEIQVRASDSSIQLGKKGKCVFLDGKQGSIRSYSYNNNVGWCLTDEQAIFNNLVVKGSIRSCVFESESVQSIGGTLFVRPSTKIKKAVQFSQQGITKIKVVVESVVGFSEGDYCRLVETVQGFSKNSSVIIEQVIANPEKALILQNSLGEGTDISQLIGQTIVDFGKEGSVGLVLNASKGGLFPQGLSVFDFKPNDIFNTRIILGKIPNDPVLYGRIANKYGLYAENALLKGSLVTQSQIGTQYSYSGMSTIYDSDNLENVPTSKARFDELIQKSKFDLSRSFQTGPILLWAGAKDDSKKGIESSNFFVDVHGNLYANSGYFSGTIITNSRINASEIHTATIVGSGETPALSIKDAENGIVFNRMIEGVAEETVFSVKTSELYAKTDRIILNKNFQINKEGSLILTNLYIRPFIGSKSAIKIEGDKLGYVSEYSDNQVESQITGYISFDQGFHFCTGTDEEKMTINSKGNFFRGKTYFENDINLGEKMEYRRQIKNGKDEGYDLYIL